MRFLGGNEQKGTTEDNGQEPEAKECFSVAAFEKSRREVDRDAARQQTNRVEDRCLKHVAGRRPREALSYVEEIRHDESREDGRLGDDETRHADPSTVRELPSYRGSRGRGRNCAH